MSSEYSQSAGHFLRGPFVGGLVLFFVELLVIGSAFKHGIDFHCLSNWPPSACGGPSGALISIYCICAALALFGFLFPAPFVRLFELAGQRVWPLAINVVGVAITLVPVTFLTEGSGTSFMVPAFAFWCVGMAAILIGLLLFLAPSSRWMELLSAEKWRLFPLVMAAAAAPALATIIRPLWQLDTIASVTFSAVSTVVQFLGYDLEIYPESRVLGANNFFIDIAPVCSGVEGIALVTIFVTFYLSLFKSELRFPHALILYPIGIAVSAALNVVRIVVLVSIGLNGNPELAVGGFHSHAGWLMFTLVSLGIIAAANMVGWLRKPDEARNFTTKKAPTPPPFFQDKTVSMILPFAVFMLSALLAQALSQTPGIVYPARAALMAMVLVLFVPLYRSLEWRLDSVAIGIGFAVGLAWALIPVADQDEVAPYDGLSEGLLVFWFVARGIGTILLVPIIEELFFRGYLETKFRRGETLPWAIGAALVVAALFAVLHGRWAEAMVASLAFSFVMYRSGRVADAIIAHGVANAVVFFVAVVTQQIHII